MTTPDLHQPDEMLVDTLQQLLTDRCPQTVVDDPSRWPELWQSLIEFGAPQIGVDEAVGGSVADAMAVLRLCGRHAAPVPIAESGFVGAWAAASAGFDLPTGLMTIVPRAQADTLTLRDGLLDGFGHDIPFARSTQLLVGVVDGHVVAADLSRATIEQRENLAAEPRDHVSFDGVEPIASAPATADLAEEFFRRLRLARGAMMVGVLERIAELTISYANEREQFGRTIVSFQAVAHRLAELVEEVCLAQMALDAATHARARGSDAAFEIEALRAVAGHAGTVVPAASHQIHGAMGMTEEYILHHLTRRLWSWSLELGGTASAETAVSRLARSAPGSLWTTLTECHSDHEHVQ